MILANLINHAVEHAPSGKAITVGNPAPALSLKHLPHLFDRFRRKEPSLAGYRHSAPGFAPGRCPASPACAPPPDSRQVTHSALGLPSLLHPPETGPPPRPQKGQPTAR